MEKMQSIQIRLARMGEREALSSLTRDAYSEFKESADPTFWSNYMISIHETLTKQEEIDRIVLELDGKLAACVILCPPYEKQMGDRIIKNPCPEMRLLAVSQQQRNKGLAGRLIDFCEAKAKEDGFESMSLHTTQLMLTAKAMYERRGYERFPEIDFEPVPGFTVWGFKKEIALRG